MDEKQLPTKSTIDRCPTTNDAAKWNNNDEIGPDSNVTAAAAESIQELKTTSSSNNNNNVIELKPVLKPTMSKIISKSSTSEIETSANSGIDSHTSSLSENDIVVKIIPRDEPKSKLLEAKTIRMIRWADGTQKAYPIDEMKSLEDGAATAGADDRIAECKTIKFSLIDGKPLEEVFKASRAARVPAPRPKLVVHSDGIKLRLRQPFKILTDIWGVLTSYHFRKELYDYIDANLETFLKANLPKKDIQSYLEELVSRTKEDLCKHPDMPPVITDNGEDILVKSVVDNLNFRRNNPDKSLMQFFDSIFNQIWNEGYVKKKLRPHVFPDVLPNFKKWQSDPFFIKIYTFASGPLEIQKLFLSATVEGDVSKWITSGFDAHHRYKYDTNKYRGVLSSLGERDPENLFYMTDSPKKGNAAIKTGMTVFIVLRDGNRKYKEETLKPFRTINSFDELEFWEFGASCC